MSIQKQILLRYRSRGHVRFSMPEVLCEPSQAEYIRENLLQINGVSQVRLHHRNNKLAIHYDESVCSFIEVAGGLSRIVTNLGSRGLKQSRTSAEKKSTWNPAEKLKKTRGARWVGEKYTEAKETFQAAKVLGKIGIKRPRAFIKDPETTIINFLNDILVLYVIKVHWTRITKQWIPHPIQNRYQWATAFYLMYLLMRSRRPK